MIGRKAQSSIEMGLMLGTFMVLAIPIVIILYNSAIVRTSDPSLEEARQYARTLAETADTVYMNNATVHLALRLPSHVSAVNVTGKEITITLATASGSTDVVAMSIAEMVVGNPIPNFEPAPHPITVKPRPDGKVEISWG
ncbi:MAG: hypothetical protein NT157_01970 [Candidatus Micrarchaeota archaeon]|nr:hypothetical protein [Candidatus Micrarchaeota archaeon]